MFYQIKFSDAETFVFADEDDARRWYVFAPGIHRATVLSAGDEDQPTPEPQAVWSEAARRKAAKEAAR